MQENYKFDEVRKQIEEAGFTIVQSDTERPWGGFFVISEEDAEKFIRHFFNGIDRKSLLTGKLSPKILMVRPSKKLSWQYHHRRAEIWKLIDGKAGVSVSDTDTEQQVKILSRGEIIQLKQGERHRLIGLEDWGVIAEIWMHTDKTHPSDEDDIVRLQDDFGR